jgi:hypothetical protein
MEADRILARRFTDDQGSTYLGAAKSTKISSGWHYSHRRFDPGKPPKTIDDGRWVIG